MMTYLVGPDVSKWQGAMDWQQTKARGADFAIIRAGSINNVTGQCYADYQWDRNRVAGPALLPCLAYWYARPNWPVERQADYFLNLVKGQDIRGLVIDLEETGGKTPKEVAAFFLRFAELLLSAGLPVLLYARADWLNRYMAAVVTNVLLWIAIHNDWLDHPWDGLDKKYKPRDWNDWAYWQFIASAPGAEWGAQSEEIDLNYFNGNRDDFDRLFGPSGEENELTDAQYQILNDKLDKIIAFLAGETEPAPTPEPVPTPEPEPKPGPVETPVQILVVKADKANARFAKRSNAAGKPILQIYPSDNAPVADRVQYKAGQQLSAWPGIVTADGGVKCWMLTPAYRRDDNDLYVLAKDVGKA